MIRSLAAYIGGTWVRDLLKSSLNRGNDYSKKKLFQWSDGFHTVFRQTWKNCEPMPWWNICLIRTQFIKITTAGFCTDERTSHPSPHSPTPLIMLQSMTCTWGDNLNYLCRWGRSILRKFQFEVICCGLMTFQKCVAVRVSLIVFPFLICISHSYARLICHSHVLHQQIKPILAAHSCDSQVMYTRGQVGSCFLTFSN